MDTTEKAIELLERAAKLGLRVEFKDGVNILKTAPSVDPEAVTVITQMMKYLPEIRSISQRRALAALAKPYVGSRIFSRDHGAGTLVGASEDGTLTISVSSEMRRSNEEESRSSQMSITADAASLLILDETQTNGTSVSNSQAVSDQPKRGIFDRLLSRSRAD